MKYTPGPWEYEQATKTIRSKPTNYWLASMDSWDGAVNHKANARLIAAAPELLEMCEDMLDGLRKIALKGTSQNTKDIVIQAMIRDLKQASAKATGGEQE